MPSLMKRQRCQQRGEAYTEGRLARRQMKKKKKRPSEQEQPEKPSRDSGRTAAKRTVSVLRLCFSFHHGLPPPSLFPLP